jgi:hypothetical protein
VWALSLEHAPMIKKKKMEEKEEKEEEKRRKEKEAKDAHKRGQSCLPKEAKVAYFIFLGPLLAHYVFGICSIISNLGPFYPIVGFHVRNIVGSFWPKVANV